MDNQSEINEMLDQLNRSFTEFREANDARLKAVEERGHAPAELEAKVDRINADITNIREAVDDLEKRAKRPKHDMENPEGDSDPEKALREQAFLKYLRRGFGEGSLTPEETRALSGASDGDGGFLVPVDFESQIIMNAYQTAEIRPQAAPRPTSRDTVQMASLGKPSVAWGRTNIAVSAQELAAGSERMTIHPLQALHRIHNDTLDDGAADVAGEIIAAFGRAVAEEEDDAFAVGAGDDSPKGIVADSRVQSNYVASGVAAALTDSTHNGLDALISCYYKPKKQYRRGAVWGMNGSTEETVRKIKDATNERYMWQPSVQAGDPPTLLGRPVINPEGLPDIGAGAFPIFFGDIRGGYAIRDRAGMSVQRLTEKYAEYFQTGFLIRKRVGGQVIKAEAFAVVKIAAS